jgi:hypothetical protein
VNRKPLSSRSGLGPPAYMECRGASRVGGQGGAQKKVNFVVFSWSIFVPFMPRFAQTRTTVICF